jgi:hypothetical protein
LKKRIKIAEDKSTEKKLHQMTITEEQNLSMIKSAMNGNNIIEFIYDQKKRIVEPFLVGELYNKYQNHLEEGTYALRAWFIEGYSSEKLDLKEGDRWTIYELDKMSDLIILNQRFLKMRPFYNPNDTSFKRINLRMEN